MSGHDIVVVGASAGGMEALQGLVRGLPADLPAAVFVVWHLPAHGFGVLPTVLSRAGPLPAAEAEDGAPIEAGHIYVAPPDRHLVLEAGKMRLTHGPKENHVRPAVDPLFRSAATVYGPRVVGVVLSGTLNDGTAGLWAIKDRGGMAVVQAPEDALFPGMPESALMHVVVDHCRPVAELGALLAELAAQAVDGEGEHPVSEALHIETRIALEDNALEAGITRLGHPSLFTCPECHGVLLQIDAEPTLRFRCHTGHAYTAEALSAHTADTIEAQLWTTLRVMEEQLMLVRQIAEQLHAAGSTVAAERVLDQAHQLQQHMTTIRAVIV